MILLTIDGAIFHEVTCTFLELDIVDCCFATRSTARYHGIIAHDYFVILRENKKRVLEELLVGCFFNDRVCDALFAITRLFWSFPCLRRLP